MRIWRKLVAAGVLASVLMVPMLVLAACATDTAASCHPCCRLMARMMAKHAGETQLRDGQAAPCCQVKSSRPAPASITETVAPTVAAGEVAATFTSIAPVVTAPVEVAVRTSPPPLQDMQSQLCTLRI